MRKQTLLTKLALLALLLAGSVNSAWADELCTASLPNFTTETSYERSSGSISGTNCTLSWSAINSTSVTGTDDNVYWKFDNGTWAQLTLTSGSFRAGDVITVKMTGAKNKTMAFKIKGHTATGVSVGSIANTPVDVTYTLVEGDIEDDGSIKITRNSSEDRFYSFTVSGSRVIKTEWDAPTMNLGDFDEVNNVYPVTLTSETGSVIKYTVADGAEQTSSSNTESLGNLAVGTKITAYATGTGYTDSEVATYYVPAAPIGGSEVLIVKDGEGDNDVKDQIHEYNAVSVAATYIAGIGNAIGTTGNSGLKLRANRKVSTFGSSTYAFHLDVNSGYTVTKVKFVELISNRDGIISVPAMQVDGVAVAGFEAFDIPASTATAITNKEFEVNATSSIAWQLTPGKYTDNDKEKDVDQFRAIIEVTYIAPSVSVTTAKEVTTYVTTEAMNFEGVSGLKAYKATAAAGTEVTLESVAAVPAGTPLVLKGEGTFAVPAIASATPIEGNLLRAGDGTTTIGGSERFDYILSNGTFYRALEGTVAVGKAYLHLDSAPARELSIVFADGETTGIQAIEAKKVENGEFYNLAGQRVAQPSKGLYIVNGKKVIIK